MQNTQKKVLPVSLILSICNPESLTTANTKHAKLSTALSTLHALTKIILKAIYFTDD